MKSSIVIISIILLLGCKNEPEPKWVYSYQYQQDASFDESDINQLMNSKYNLLDELQLNDNIKWSKMKLVDSVFLKKNACLVYIYRYDSNMDHQDYLCYTTKDHIKLVAYWSKAIDTELVFVLKDYKYQKKIIELIKNNEFIFNQLNESMPIPMPQ